MEFLNFIGKVSSATFDYWTKGKLRETWNLETHLKVHITRDFLTAIKVPSLPDGGAVTNSTSTTRAASNDDDQNVQFGLENRPRTVAIMQQLLESRVKIEKFLVSSPEKTKKKYPTLQLDHVHLDRLDDKLNTICPNGIPAGIEVKHEQKYNQSILEHKVLSKYIPNQESPHDKLHCEWVQATTTNNEIPGKDTILTIHGGAFIILNSDSHRDVAARLSNAWNARAFVVDYRLAPEYKYPSALFDCVTALIHLVKDCSVAVENLIIHGDSAGGNLAHALVLFVRDYQHALEQEFQFHEGTLDMSKLKALVTFSPFLDTTLSLPSIELNIEFDILIDKNKPKRLNPNILYLKGMEGVELIGVSGPGSVQEECDKIAKLVPYISPVYHHNLKTSTLPRRQIIVVGTCEILFSESLLYYTKSINNGKKEEVELSDLKDTTIEIRDMKQDTDILEVYQQQQEKSNNALIIKAYEDMFHVFMYFNEKLFEKVLKQAKDDMDEGEGGVISKIERHKC